MDWLPADRAAHLRGDRPGRPGLRRALRVRGDPPHRRRAARAGPHHPARRAARAARRRHRADDERREAAPRSRTIWPRPGCGGSTCRSTRCDRDAFLALTKRDELDRVLAGIDAALDAGLDPVKVNAVVMRGINDDEVVDLAALRARQGRRRALHRVHAARRRRASGAATRSCPPHEILERIDAVFPLERGRSRRGVEPAARFRVPRRHRRRRRHRERDRAVLRELRPGAAHRRGPVPHCLFALDETDLRAVLRAGGGLDATRPRRPPGRRDRAARSARSGPGTASAQVDFVRPDRSMSQIGG